MAVRFGSIFGDGRAFVPQLLDMPGDHLAAIAVREEAARAFARVNGIPDGALQTVLMRPVPGEPLGRVHYHGLILDRDQVETAAMRIAPNRLAQDLAAGHEPWQRYLWSIRCLPADSETGEVLHDRCPECGCPFWWRDIHEITRCPNLSCGLRLASIPARRLRGANLLSLQSLANLFRPQRDAGVWKRLPEAVSEWPVADVLDLIDWLARLEGRVRGWSDAGLGLRERSKGLALLEEWPVSIEHHLERYWRVRGSKGRLGRVLVAGELETILQNLRSERAREFVGPVLRRVRR
ncbi:hypothetical protein C4E04_10320 [Microvirga sp. 17 mud 1-3]|nr:hypothetical protein C4E04_10320 [Microvirga sp. 17 mud 1-3]